MTTVRMRITTTNLIVILIAIVEFTGCKESSDISLDNCDISKYSGEWDFHYFSDKSRIFSFTINYGDSYNYSGTIKAIPSTCQISVPTYESGSLILKVESSGEILNTCGNNAPAHWSISCSGYFEGDSIFRYDTYEQSPPNQIHIYRTSLIGIKKGSTIKGRAPTAVTLDASNVTSSSATLNAIVNPNLLSTISAFQLGTMTRSYITYLSIPGTLSSGLDENVSFTDNYLTPKTTYYFRIRSSNKFGTTYGSEMSFTTPP